MCEFQRKREMGTHFNRSAKKVHRDDKHPSTQARMSWSSFSGSKDRALHAFQGRRTLTERASSTTSAGLLFFARLEAWLEQARTSQIREPQGFAANVERDKAAVMAGLTLHQNNGLVEGRVNKMKLVKRMGYGRASISLLRKPSSSHLLARKRISSKNISLSISKRASPRVCKNQFGPIYYLFL
jgi:hypothetical protein